MKRCSRPCKEEDLQHDLSRGPAGDDVSDGASSKKITSLNHAGVGLM